MNVLELRDVTLSTGEWRLHVSLTMQHPVTALFGPSGAGKTTLLEIIAGLRKPSSGSVRLGRELLSDAATNHFLPPEKRGIGYVPQDLALFPHRTVHENLLYGAGRGAGDPAQQTFERLVEVLGLAGSLARYPDTLSGGEKQRVALGRALLSQPRLLLLDEPLSSLDRPLRRSLLDLLVRVRDEFGTPMLYVTHEPAELAGLCDDVILIQRGAIIRHGAFDSLFESTFTPGFQLRDSARQE